jgi:hypothetical protein
MWIDKMAGGVLRVQTALGPRYLVPSWLQRVYLVWMFRNFTVLPHMVLSRRQQRMVDRLCSEQKFASVVYADVLDEAPIIGTIERRPAGFEDLSPRRPMMGITVAEPRIMPVEVRPH